MRRLAWLVLVLASAAADAQTCRQWSWTSGVWHDNPQEACTDAQPVFHPSQCPHDFGNQANGTYPAWQCTGKYWSGGACSSGSEFSDTQNLTARTNPNGCPVCPPIGEIRTVSGTGGIGTSPSMACLEGCSFARDGVGIEGAGGNWTMTYSSKGTPCSGTGATANDDDEDDKDCDATGAICKDPGDGSGSNCGIYNGDRVCVDSAPPGGCVGYTSGGVACKGADNGSTPPATPPAPNNGTPGTPATPDATVTSTRGGGTIHYYGPGTVSGSSEEPETGPATPSGGYRPIGPGTGGSDGGSSGGGDGDGEGDGGGECTGPSCDADVPDLDDIGTVSEAFGSFWGSLNEVPLVEAATGLGASLGSGACPDWSTSIAVYGETWDVDFSGICTTWDSVSAVLSIVMLVFWGFIAFRILFSA